MSYNTRRQSGQGMGGMGRGSAQVLYHQQQRSGPTRMQQSSVPTPPQHGYNTQQPIQTVSSGYSTQQSSPAYSTQSSGASTPGYTTQSCSEPRTDAATRIRAKREVMTPSVEHTPTSKRTGVLCYQTQQQPPPPQPPQPQAPPPTPREPQPPMPQQPPQPPIKAEPITPKASLNQTGMEVDSEGASEAGDGTKVKSWQLKKKMPGFKINKKVKKRRQNARLRKILQPKNAIMVLNELKTGIKFTFQEHTNALTQTMFVVNAEVDGKVHTGQGLSKPLAKQNAAENALKALLLEKMAQAAMKAESSANNDGSEPMQEDSNNGTSVTANASSGEGTEEGAETANKPEAPEDDVPWGSLASFALYKLFTDWQSQGTHVPIPKQTSVPAGKQVFEISLPPRSSEDGNKIQSSPAPMKKVPDNPTDRHPVMLLNQMRPGIQFTEISREGTPPNLTFTLGVTVDGKLYTGVAKNKKDAKKEAAKSALAGSLSIFYD